MTLEVEIRDRLEPVYVDREFTEFVNDLNIATAQGKHFIITDEDSGGPIAFEARNITVIREAGGRSAFIGR
jgi:hypothetical protein